jgi:hypothetical protein
MIVDHPLGRWTGLPGWGHLVQDIAGRRCKADPGLGSRASLVSVALAYLVRWGCGVSDWWGR